MKNIDLAIEIYKRLLEVGINASMASVPIIEEVLNEERERNLTKDAPDRLWRPQEYDTGHPDPMFIVKESRTNGGG